MNDLKMVIEGLGLCLEGLCDICSYKNSNAPGGCKDELMYDAMILLKAQEPPTNTLITSAIECLLHPQDADDSDMAKAIDTAVRAMRSLKAQEPRLITPEDFEQADAYGYIPVWQECKIGVGYYTVVPVGILDYGEKGIYRYWTSKPSLKQMEETPWN